MDTSTWTTKVGLAQMLKGGVIMDVVTSEHARIAEAAGAVAVMALERVPADIRVHGGVARMSDPDERPPRCISLDKEDVMFKKNRTEVRQREYHGLRSHIFLQQGDLPQTNLSITWVDVPPRARQMLHRHGPEQVYVIIEGTGRMRVGEEEEEVVKVERGVSCRRSA